MADLIQPRTLKGFRDYPPELMIPREHLLEQARRVQGPVQALRVYRLSWDALPRDGDRPANVHRTLTYACS